MALAILFLPFAVTVCSPALASVGGSVGIDSESFFESSGVRGTSSEAISVEPELETSGKAVSAVVSPRAEMFTSDASSLTFDAGQAYVATSPVLLPHHEVTVGRRYEDWSAADRFWQLGLWEPRFDWDPLHPERDGETGFFYEYHSRYWHVTFFGSPMNVPDRSYPINAVNGQLTSPSPDFPPPYRSVYMPGLGGQVTPINYAINTPPTQNLVLNAGAAASVRCGDETGPWGLVTAGELPSNQLDDAVLLGLNPVGQVVNAAIEPRVYMHSMLSVESGFNLGGATDSVRWTFWTSVTREIPQFTPAADGAISAPIGPSWIGAAGGSFEATRWLRIEAGFLQISEDKPSPDDEQATLSLPPRFNLTSAVRAGLKWLSSEHWRPELSWTHDFANPANFASFDLTYTPRGSSWSFGAGADAFASTLGEGFYGNYAGDDRVRGRIAYAF